MMFVSDNHILVQFENKYVPYKENGQIKEAVEVKFEEEHQTVIFKSNGKMVTQTQEVENLL